MGALSAVAYLYDNNTLHQLYTAGNLVAGFSPRRRPNSDNDNSIGEPSRKKGWRIRQPLGSRLPLAFPTKPLKLSNIFL